MGYHAVSGGVSEGGKGSCFGMVLRKRLSYVGALLFDVYAGIAAIITATCNQLELMFLGRTLYGLGIGFAMHAAPACE